MLRQPLLCRKLVIFRFMLWNAYVGGGFHLELVHGFTGFFFCALFREYGPERTNMNDEELRDYLKRFCFGREHLICSRDLVRQKNLRESDLRKKVNRLRRKAVPIASSREGYFYASNAAELYSTIRQLKEMRAGLDAAICGLEQAMGTFTEPSDGGGRDR